MLSRPSPVGFNGPEFQGGHGEFTDSLRKIRHDAKQRDSQQGLTPEQDLAERKHMFEQGKYVVEQADAQRKEQSAAQTASREEAFKQIEAYNTEDGKLDTAAASIDKAFYMNPDNPNYDFSDPEYGVPARYDALDKILKAGRKEFGPIDAIGSFFNWHDGKPNKAQLESFYGGLRLEGNKLYLSRPDGKDSTKGNMFTRNYVRLNNLDPKTRALVERVTQVDGARKEAGLRGQGG